METILYDDGILVPIVFFHSLGDAAIVSAEAGMLAKIGAPDTTTSPAFGGAAHRATWRLHPADAVAAHGRT